MTDKDLSQKILTDIKEKNITTKARWEFLLKDYFIWFLFVVAVVVGSLAMSVIIFIFKHSALSSAMQVLEISEGMFELPYFWLLILLVFIVIAYYNFRHTKQGYKYNVYIVFLASVVISIVFGFILYYLKGGEQLEQAFYQRIPFYRQMIDQKGRVWLAPEEGRLAGVINSDIVQQEGVLGFELKSFNGQNWNVSCHDSEDFQNGLVHPGSRVILIGQAEPPNNFYVDFILPWFAPHERMLKFHNDINERNNKGLRINR